MVTERELERASLGDVVQLRGRAVRVDVSDFLRRDASVLQRERDRAGCLRPIWQRRGEMVSIVRDATRRPVALREGRRPLALRHGRSRVERRKSYVVVF
jgi:hypothetical protein